MWLWLGVQLRGMSGEVDEPFHQAQVFPSAIVWTAGARLGVDTGGPGSLNRFGHVVGAEPAGQDHG